MSKSNESSEEGDSSIPKTFQDLYRRFMEIISALPCPIGETLSAHAAHTQHEDVPSDSVRSPEGAPAAVVQPVSNQVLGPVGMPESQTAPDNFGTVEQGCIYRSSYPHLEHYSFLKSLGLKTILTLVPEQISPEYEQFMKDNGIQHFQVHIPANKGAVRINACEMTRALEIVLDRRNHPLLIHCNKGKHRTGCVVGCFRRVQGEESAAVYNEYHKYAREKSRVFDEAFIEQFHEGTVLFMARKYNWIDQKTPPSPVSTLSSTPAAGSHCD